MDTFVGRRLHAAPSVLGHLVLQQQAVASRRQLVDAGVRPARLRAQLAARRWQAVGRNVVVLHNAALTAGQRRWVAVLLPEQPAALAGVSGAAEAGLQGFEDEHVHIVVSGSCAVPLPPWVRLHNSRRFSVRDIAGGGGPPRTRTARSVVDAAAWSRYPRRAGALLCAAVQQRLVTPTELGQAVRDAGHVRHVALMRAMIGDLAGGGHTLAEIDFGRLARRAGLPRPQRQRLRPEPGGHIRYLDVEFELPDGTALAVEVDGRHHAAHEQWTADLSRQNEVVIGGRAVLRFDSLSVRTDEARVVDQLRRMHRAHGG